MLTRRKTIILILCLTICLFLGQNRIYAQGDDLDFLDLDELDESDSLLIYALIDDILTAEIPKSTLMLRTGYGNGSSTLISSQANRQNTYGSLGYNHKSGFSINGIANLSSRFAPHFYGLTLSAGYNGEIGQHVTFSHTYDYSWFNDVVEKSDNAEIDFSDLRHTWASYIDYSYKGFTLGIDYNHFIGTETHRLTPSLSTFILIPKVPILKQLIFAPTVFALLGNDKRLMTSYTFNTSSFVEFERLTGRDLSRINDINVDNLGDRAFNFFSNAIEANSLEDQSFRGLNAIFSLPFLYTKGKLSLLISYSLNIPFRKDDSFGTAYKYSIIEDFFVREGVSLGNDAIYQQSNYFSFSLSYSLLNKKKVLP